MDGSGADVGDVQVDAALGVAVTEGDGSAVVEEMEEANVVWMRGREMAHELAFAVGRVKSADADAWKGKLAVGGMQEEVEAVR